MRNFGSLGSVENRIRCVVFAGLVALLMLVTHSGDARAAATNPAFTAAQATVQPVCNSTCTALCAIHEVDGAGMFTCQPTAACTACVNGQPAKPPMCVPSLDPSDPYYAACIGDGAGDPPAPPHERALLITNTLGTIDNFVAGMETVYRDLMSFHDGEYWGELIGMHSIEVGTLQGATHEFELRTAAYRSSCHDEFTARIDIDIQAGVTLQILMDGYETHFFSGPFVTNDFDITWQGLPNAVIKVIYDTTGLIPGGSSIFDTGFDFKEFYVSSSGAACSPVAQLNTRTLRSALAGAGVVAEQSSDVIAVTGAELFYVEADGPLQYQAPSPPAVASLRTLSQPSTASPSADPWMTDHTTSLRNLMDCDPAGATCSDPTNGGSDKAYDRHGGGDPQVVVVQIDTNLNSEAMIAAGDYKLPARWYHNAGVSNQQPGGGGSGCGSSPCVAHPDPSHDNHGTGVSSWFSTLVDGNGFSALTPNSTYWFAGTGLDFNDLSIATYEVAVSDVIARLGDMDPTEIDVVSLSFGTSVPSIAMASAIGDYTDVGVLFVAAAGNENNAFPIFPASASTVVGVGSTGTYDLVSLGTKTFSDVDELSTFYYPFPGTWGSNKGGDVVMAGAGPLPNIAEYKCALSGLECLTDEDCLSATFPNDTCSDQDNLYEEFVGMGTSHATPQIAALLANTLADVMYVNPQDYPEFHLIYNSLPTAEARKVYRANVLKAALFQSAERWFPTVELPHEEFGFGRGDHMAIMQFMLDSEQANSTPGQYAVNSTDIGRSLFVKDPADSTWEDLEPDRMGMLGAGSADPTQTTFRAQRGVTVGSCARMFHPVYMIGALIGEPLKVRVDDPFVTHDTSHYNHQKTEMPDNVLVEFAMQQRIEVKIDTTRWGLLECLLPFFFDPKDQSFFSVIEQQDLSPTTRKNWEMTYSLDGYGYNYQMSDLVPLANPPYTSYEITPKCCSFADAMSDEIEDSLEDFDQFLRTYLLPSVEIEAMDMVEAGLDVHLAFNRTTPQQYWTTRFANSHPSWSPPQFQHWKPGGSVTGGADHRNLDLAPLGNLSSVQKVPVLRPVLSAGGDPHLYQPYPPEIDILDPQMEPVSEIDRWDDISFQSVNTIREQWNQADLNDAHKPGGMNEFFTTPNDKISDMLVRLTNLQQRDVRPTVTFFDVPTVSNHYGQITSRHEADLWSCANDPVDRPPEDVLPIPSFDCTPSYHGTFLFELTFNLDRNDWYAAMPISEIGKAGPYHHFENRLTVDTSSTSVEITQSPNGLPWWSGGPDPCDDISNPHMIGRNCDIAKAEVEKALLGIYAPAMTRLVDSMSFDRFGVNANLGIHYLTLMRQLDFLQSYLQDMYDFNYDGFDYDIGAMDGATSSPEYQRISEVGKSSTIVHKIQLNRAPAGERKNGDPDEDLRQPNSPSTSTNLASFEVEVKYGRCVNDNAIACDSDAQCGGFPNACVSLRYCSLGGQLPAQYPLSTCTEATIVADCGTSGQWECNRVETRSRYADRADVTVANTAAQSTSSLNESHFTRYKDGTTSVQVDSDLWLAMASGPGTVFAVDLEPGSSLKKPDAQPFDHNYVVDGFSRYENSLVRSDTCLWRANIFFTYDRWADCPAGGAPCSSEFGSRHSGYRLTQTRQNWDINPEDPSCSAGGGPVKKRAQKKIID